MLTIFSNKGSLKNHGSEPYSKNPRLCEARVLVRVTALNNHIEIGKMEGGYSRCCLHGSTSYNRTVYLTTFGTSSDCTSVLPCKQHLEKIQRTRKLGELHVNPPDIKRLLIRMPLSWVWNPCHQLVMVHWAGLTTQLQLVHSTTKFHDFSKAWKRLLQPISWGKLIFLGCDARWWLWCKAPSQNLLGIVL